MKVKLSLIIISVFLCMLTACDLNRQYLNQEADRNDAEALVDNFYQLLSEKNYSAAFNNVNPSLWRSTDSLKLSEFFMNLTVLSGGLKERKLDHWETTRVVGYNQSTYYKMYYINKYDNLELKVSMILQKDILDDRIKIIGFQASPEKFL